MSESKTIHKTLEEFPDTKYFILDENTIVYRIPGFPPDFLGILHGSVLRGGKDWRDGFTHVTGIAHLRPATVKDFHELGARPEGHLVPVTERRCVCVLTT